MTTVACFYHFYTLIIEMGIFWNHLINELFYTELYYHIGENFTNTGLFITVDQW